MCVLCLSGGKLVKRGRSNEEHSNSRKTPRSDWLYTADCTHGRWAILIALPRVCVCVCVCGCGCGVVSVYTFGMLLWILG